MTRMVEKITNADTYQNVSLNFMLLKFSIIYPQLNDNLHHVLCELVSY